MPQPRRLQFQPDSPLLRQGGQNRDAVLQYGTKVEGFFHRRRPPALQSAYLKNVIYQRQQMLCRYTDFFPAILLPLGVVLTVFQDGQHPQDPVDGRAEIVRHMGEEFTFCRVGLSHTFQKLHDGLFLFFPRHHGFCNVLVVSVQAGARLFECPVRHAAAADIYFSKFWMAPRVNHLGSSGPQYFLYRLLNHLHIVGFNALKPVLIALFRIHVIRHAQENPHGPVRIHPGPAVFLQLNGPDAGPGSLQNILQALPPLQIAPFLKLPEQIAPLQGGHDKIRRRLEHIRRIFQ